MRASRDGEQRYEPEEKRPLGRGAKALVVIAVCVILYFLCAGFMGDWLADNVVTPILSVFEPVENDSADDVPVTDVENTGTDTSEITAELALPDLSLFALQYGIYEQQANADADASLVKSRGGAGYIYDSDYMRVMVSAYSDGADADTVHDKLLSDENYETWPYTIEAKGPTLKVTATAPDISALKDFFGYVEKCSADIEDCSFKYDSGSMGAEDISAHFSDMASGMQEHKNLLLKLGQDDGGVLPYILELADSLAECLSFSSDGKTEVEISSALKYNYIWYTDVYSGFLEIIENGG